MIARHKKFGKRTISAVAGVSALAAGLVLGTGSANAASSATVSVLLNGTSTTGYYMGAWHGANTSYAVDKIAINLPASGNATLHSEGYWMKVGTPSSQTLVTGSVPDSSANEQRGIYDDFPDGSVPVSGNFFLESSENPNPASIQNGGLPGKGVNNDVWITDGTSAHKWKIIDSASNICHLSTDGTNRGVNWPRLSSDGTQIVWAQYYEGPTLGGRTFGGWRMCSGTIQWSASHVPSLVSLHGPYWPQTNNFYEPYGFVPNGPDKGGVIFASSYGQTSTLTDQIFTVSPTAFDNNAAPSHQLTHTHSDAMSGGDYNEFAFYTPGNGHIIYASTYGAQTDPLFHQHPDLDWWMMNTDGTNQVRLTFMNRETSSQWQGFPVEVGGLAFNPGDSAAGPYHVAYGASWCVQGTLPGCTKSDESSSLFTMTVTP